MAQIVVSENITLDGVVQDPVGDDGFRLGGWFGQFAGNDREAWARILADEAERATALLMGRRTEEWFAARWLSRTGDWADRLNSMPKYVISSTLREPRWSNSTILSGDAVTEVSQLRKQLDGDIVVNGSIQLARTLIEHDLVDELRLTVYPVVLGEGDRLFGAVSDRRPLRLARAQALGDSLAFMIYKRAPDPSGHPAE
jgi:dihydrofolate reductase